MNENDIKLLLDNGCFESVEEIDDAVLADPRGIGELLEGLKNPSKAKRPRKGKCLVVALKDGTTIRTASAVKVTARGDSVPMAVSAILRKYNRAQDTEYTAEDVEGVFPLEKDLWAAANS